MTAEVAILNKMAVALATDSTITASYGLGEPKAFNTADKLFELSKKQPIGIMFFGDANILDLPVASLVKEFRKDSDNEKRVFATVDGALREFLAYLAKEGLGASTSVRHNDVLRRLLPEFRHIEEQVSSSVSQAILNYAESAEAGNVQGDLRVTIRAVVETRVEGFLQQIASYGDAEFFGDGERNPLPPEVIDDLISRVGGSLKIHFSRAEVEALVHAFLESALILAPTGLVVAGFGDDERLPSLSSCKVDGFACGQLKVQFTNQCDIDRDGRSAAFYGFAQHDVMDRFLYGFDEVVRDDVVTFTGDSLASVFTNVMSVVEQQVSDPAILAELAGALQTTRSAFLSQMEQGCFDLVKNKGVNEIEDMIRFMPKPELADLAESLIHLTSLRRRVSKGIETVGGPIDVAVISRSEGFVWVKRKHYFSSDVNPGFVAKS